MDKNAIKKYAVWARRELIERVAKKAQQYGIEEKTQVDANADSIGGKLLSPSEKKERQALLIQIKDKGYEQVMEEVAYTWFNRFSALRFMEVNGYLPTHVRVFTDEANNFKPQILTEAIHMEMDGLDMNKVFAFKDANQTDELYKYLLITQCNALNTILPGMFQKIADYTELLLPDNLLREGSVIEQMITLVPEDNFDTNSENGQVEIIGWLYQYYNDEVKNQVINIYKGAVKKEDIPAATQLFTTDWVVRYIIDNTVGRYWIERNPNSKLKDELEYFIEPKVGNIQYVNETIKPEDVTVFDPCMGSGHFLIYAFEVLMKIYREYGYSDRDAVSSIVQNNIFGLDIDDRSSQLSYFAVMMKAKEYDLRFFSRKIQPQVYAIQDSRYLDEYALEDFAKGNTKLLADVKTIIATMENAKEYGSIIQVPQLDFEAIFNRFDELEDEISIYAEIQKQELLPLINVCYLMVKKYAVVATNPPYLNKLAPKLKKFVTDKYKDYSGDLFSVFIYRNFDFCKKDGYSGFMTPFVWMFIKTYEKLREYITQNKSIKSLIQMEYSAFEEATVPICSFILKNGKETDEGLYIKLSDFKGGMQVQKEKVLQALENKECEYFYETTQESFLKIPGSPIAYWVSENILKSFENEALSNFVNCKSGIMTGDDKFIKFWYELFLYNIKFDCHSSKEMGKYKWFPLNSGGGFRNWYGNNEKVVDLWHDGFNIRANVKNYRLRDSNLYFQKGITWGRITSSKIAFREVIQGSLFGDAGPIAFVNEDREYILGFLCSKIVGNLLNAINPTLNFQVSDIVNIPIIISNNYKSHVESLVEQNISISKTDWDSFETSWDFEKHPLIKYRQYNALWGEPVGNEKQEFKNNGLIESSFKSWQTITESQFAQLKQNEEELNRIFIEIYGLQDELTPEVADKDVTIRKADLTRDIKSFISYAVGCMFGRYSLDENRLIYAGGDWDATKYCTFEADLDNIIPICDDEYFEDDIVGRFVKFVEVVYGKDTLQENLKFIADALGSKGQPKEVIRNYFMNDFYKDHCKMYKKRPIYWQFYSGKKNGFKCLIYMHRYQPDTIMRIRTDYVHEQQSRYRTAIADLEQRIDGASTSDHVKLTKKLNTLQAQAVEIREYEEKIHHLADQMIRIDLDDGVKANYEIFKDVLAKIK